jgi:hypothetical protein
MLKTFSSEHSQVLIPESFCSDAVCRIFARHSCYAHGAHNASLNMLHTDAFVPEDSKVLAESHPLSISSGNLQRLNVSARDGLENQGLFLKTEPQYPVPTVKLGSNDGSNHIIDQRLKKWQHNLPGPRTVVDPERPYLHNPKYLEYRSRHRQEIGKDGKPIWPPHIEAAFQNGMSTRLAEEQDF